MPTDKPGLQSESAVHRYRRLARNIRVDGGVGKDFTRAETQLNDWLQARTKLSLIVHFPVGHMAIVGTIVERRENTFLFVSLSKEMSVVVSPWVYRKIRFWKSESRAALKMVKSFVRTEFGDNVVMMELGSSDAASLLEDLSCKDKNSRASQPLQSQREVKATMLQARNAGWVALFEVFQEIHPKKLIPEKDWQALSFLIEALREQKNQEDWAQIACAFDAIDGNHKIATSEEWRK